MLTRPLPTTPLETTVIGHGTWATGGTHWGQADDDAAVEAIVRSLDSGVTLVDTAPVYGHGHAEELVGRAVKGRRDGVVISNKCGLLINQGTKRSLRPEDIRMECDESLARLDTDHMDIYFCHWPDTDTPIEDSIGTLMELRNEGKIKGIGLSNHEPDLIRRACAAGEISCLQEHYSLLLRDIEHNGVLDTARELGLGVLAYAPLGGGVLTGKYTQPPAFGKRDVRTFFYPFYKEPYWSRTQDLLAAMRAIAESHDVPLAHVAIAWVNGREGITSALVGAKNTAQAESNAAAGDLVLTEDEMRTLTEASDRAVEGLD